MSEIQVLPTFRIEYPEKELTGIYVSGAVGGKFGQHMVLDFFVDLPEYKSVVTLKDGKILNPSKEHIVVRKVKLRMLMTPTAGRFLANLIMKHVGPAENAKEERKESDMYV